jgi:hypothetical protein
VGALPFESGGAFEPACDDDWDGEECDAPDGCDGAVKELMLMEMLSLKVVATKPALDYA